MRVSERTQLYPRMQRDDRSVVSIRNQRSGLVVADHVVLATGTLSRARGLLGRTGLPEGHGLWLEPCSSIHMFFMRFAIDVAFVDREDRVVAIAANVRPWRIAGGGWHARAALELSVGALAAADVRVGDRLTLEPA